MELEGLIIVLYSQSPVIGSYSDPVEYIVEFEVFTAPRRRHSSVEYISHSNTDFSKILSDIVFISSKSPHWNLLLRFSNINLYVGFEIPAAVVMNSFVTPRIPSTDISGKRIVLKRRLTFKKLHGVISRFSETSVDFQRTAELLKFI
jgi:hypothetical protein